MEREGGKGRAREKSQDAGDEGDERKEKNDERVSNYS